MKRGDWVANIVLDCTDGVPNAAGNKDDWRQGKEADLNHLRTLDRTSLLVSACDKLHNAKSIVPDLRAGHDVFSCFKAGGEGRCGITGPRSACSNFASVPMSPY